MDEQVGRASATPLGSSECGPSPLGGWGGSGQGISTFPKWCSDPAPHTQSGSSPHRVLGSSVLGENIGGGKLPSPTPLCLAQSLRPWLAHLLAWVTQIPVPEGTLGHQALLRQGCCTPRSTPTGGQGTDPPWPASAACPPGRVSSSRWWPELGAQGDPSCASSGSCASCRAPGPDPAKHRHGNRKHVVSQWVAEGDAQALPSPTHARPTRAFFLQGPGLAGTSASPCGRHPVLTGQHRQAPPQTLVPTCTRLAALRCRPQLQHTLQVLR